MFEFGTVYTFVILIVGLFVSVAPKPLIGRLPENVMKVYMMATGAIYTALIGTNAHIGMTDVARQMEMDDKLRHCLNIIHTSPALFYIMG